MPWPARVDRDDEQPMVDNTVSSRPHAPATIPNRGRSGDDLTSGQHRSNHGGRNHRPTSHLQPRSRSSPAASPDRRVQMVRSPAGTAIHPGASSDPRLAGLQQQIISKVSFKAGQQG
ncbi:hypothetical protein ACLOJK_034800 [Asimina triloba]